MIRSSVLSVINQIINDFEDAGMQKEASLVHDIYSKCAKAKSKSKKNVPNNPSLWSECKSWAKRTFDVYPSAYANGAAAKRYKSKGGTWRKEK
jgi:hypothetical protein